MEIKEQFGELVSSNFSLVYDETEKWESNIFYYASVLPMWT